MRIFLSYRRDDAGGWTTALAAALQSRFGSKNVFIDVDHIQNFENFEQRILTSIDQCDLVLAIIGKHWLTIQDQEGQRRLQKPGDYVRREIARALEHRLPVLPVLVDGSALPDPHDLPEDLRDLLRPNFQRLSHERLEEDLQELLHRIEMRRPSRRPVLVAILAFIAGILSGVLGSAIARRYLVHALPDCPGLVDCPNPYCYTVYGDQATGYGTRGHEFRDEQQNQGAQNTPYGSGTRDVVYGKGSRSSGYGKTGYGYPGYGYRGGVGGSLL